MRKGSKKSISVVSRKPNENQSRQMLEKLKKSTSLNSLIEDLLKKASWKLGTVTASMSALKYLFRLHIPSTVEETDWMNEAFRVKGR